MKPNTTRISDAADRLVEQLINTPAPKVGAPKPAVTPRVTEARRTVEIDDTLPDRVASAIEDVKEELLRYCAENEPTSFPCLNNDLDYSGSIHEIIDSSVPIYTKEIEDAWYLHGRELEQAYENAGIGENPRENDGMVAIYCYIQDEVNEWYQNEGEEIFDNWYEEHKAKQDAEDDEPEAEEEPAEAPETPVEGEPRPHSPNPEDESDLTGQDED